MCCMLCMDCMFRSPNPCPAPTASPRRFLNADGQPTRVSGDDSIFHTALRSVGRQLSEAREAYEALLPAVDLLFAPERDVRSVLGFDGEPAALATQLRAEYDCETVVLTRGEDGALATTDAKTVEQPAIAADTVDAVGSGDAFVGGYLSQTLRGEDIERCLSYGAATAALKRTISGDVAVVTESEVDRVLDNETSDIDR